MATGQKRTERIEVRTAARRVLADRDVFELDDDMRRAWDEVDQRRPRDLPGLRALLERPAPPAFSTAR